MHFCAWGLVAEVRQVRHNAGLGGHELHDVVDGQVLVLGNVDRLDVCVGHVKLLPADEVLQEVDGDVVYGTDWVRGRLS